MRIINVNKFYYLRGGAERYFFSLAALLTSHGHEVIPFSMQHPQNLSTPYAKYFSSYMEFGKRGVTPEAETLARAREAEHGEVPQVAGPRAVARMFWSFEVAKKFDQLLRDTKPDLIHLHNIYHQLSPSFLPVAKRHGIPVVMTVHDYKLVWPDYLLCGWRDGASPWNVVRSRCTHGSYAKSFLTFCEWRLHQWLRVYQKNIDLFLAPSEFVREKLIAGGYDKKTIRVLPHFIHAEARSTKHEARKSILYFGRLSKEKGLDILLEMMHHIGSGVELRIAGEGPEGDRLRIKNQESRIKNVVFLGRLGTEALQREIDRALFVVVPSIVPETFGYAILESFARGKTVLASRIGAFPELVSDGKNGFLVSPGDAKQLGEKATYLLTHPRERNALERNALASAGKYTGERHYASLFGYYQQLS